MIDQSRAIDTRRFRRLLGRLPEQCYATLKASSGSEPSLDVPAGPHSRAAQRLCAATRWFGPGPAAAGPDGMCDRAQPQA
jgi:hypothetical protein